MMSLSEPVPGGGYRYFLAFGVKVGSGSTYFILDGESPAPPLAALWSRLQLRVDGPLLLGRGLFTCGHPPVCLCDNVSEHF